LNDLKSLYRIEFKSGNHNERERVIETKSSTNTIDVIYEKFIRLNILEPRLKSYIKNSYKTRLPTIVNNLDKQNPKFIERDNNVIDEISELLKSHICLCVHGEMGTGKKQLATELGWRLHADYCVRVFHFDEIKDDFRQFAELLGAHLTDNSKYLVENVATRLRMLDDRKFLFIILDVLDFKDMEVYMTEQILSLTNVKFLLTTPHEDLKFEQKVSFRFKKFGLDLFGPGEADKYLSEYYERNPRLDENQKKRIFEICGMRRAE